MRLNREMEMHKKREEGLIAIILLIVCTLTVLLTFNGSMKG